jgi:NADPH2:quinone reductase
MRAAPRPPETNRAPGVPGAGPKMRRPGRRSVAGEMKATVIAEYGDPTVLRVRDVPVPRPGAGEVAIDVAYAGVNYAEVMARRGALPPFQPPFVPGLEVSGTVRAVGDGVVGLRPGAPVCALTTRGGYAEVAIAPAALTYTLPGGADDDLRAGAAMPTIVPTAWALIHVVGRVRPGEAVLVHAAAGGVGIVAGQVARTAGAGRVLGVTSTDDKARYARRFGYDDVLCTDDWDERVRALGGGRGPDVILDSVGGDVRTRSFALLAPLGRLVLFGNASGAPEDGVPGGALRTQVKATLGWSITGLASVDPEAVARIARPAFAAVARGDVRVDVTDVFPLDDAARAHRLLEDRASTGKLLLAVGAA